MLGFIVLIKSLALSVSLKSISLPTEVTCSFDDFSRSVRFLPINPVPPVTRPFCQVLASQLIRTPPYYNNILSD